MLGSLWRLMSKSRPCFLSSSSLRMIGTRKDPFDGGARPPAPDLLLCAQELPPRRKPAETAAPAANPRRTERRDILSELFMLLLIAPLRTIPGFTNLDPASIGYG